MENTEITEYFAVAGLFFRAGGLLRTRARPNAHGMTGVDQVQQKNCLNPTPLLSLTHSNSLMWVICGHLKLVSVGMRLPPAGGQPLGWCSSTPPSKKRPPRSARPSSAVGSAACMHWRRPLRAAKRCLHIAGARPTAPMTAANDRSFRVRHRRVRQTKPRTREAHRHVGARAAAWVGLL